MCRVGKKSTREYDMSFLVYFVDVRKMDRDETEKMIRMEMR